MKALCLVLMAVVVSVSSALMQAYSVEPRTAAESGWTPRDGVVAQTTTANFDSVAYCELFVGDTSEGGLFNVEIRDYESNTLVALKEGVHASRGHAWLKFDLETQTGQQFVRGRQYLVELTRPGDSVNYFYQTGSPYEYGKLSLGGFEQTDRDLCMRVYTKAYVGDEFAVHSNIANHPQEEPGPLGDSTNWRHCIEREREVGVKYDKIGYAFWDKVQPDSVSQWNWDWLDYLMIRFAQNGVRPIMSLRGTPGWATCARESVFINGAGFWRPNGGAFARNLFCHIKSGNAINDSNLYAKYIYEFVRRYGPKGYAFNDSLAGTFWRANDTLGNYLPILLFEGFPEVPYSGLDRHWVPESAGGYWRLDAKLHKHKGATWWPHKESLVDLPYRDTLANHIQYCFGDTVAGRKSSLASTYARLMVVVDSAVKLACLSPEIESIRPLSVAFITDDGMYGMSDWLQRLMTYGADGFFDIGSYFGYQSIDPDRGRPEGQASTLDWLRACLEDAGYERRPFSVTEFGTCEQVGADQVRRAGQLQRSYVSMQHANAQPFPPAEQCAWFTFTKQYMGDDIWPITDTAPDFESWAPAHAYCQLSELTLNASYEEKIPVATEDCSLYVHQYEDSAGSKFWVAWSARYADPESTVRIPVRSDIVDTVPTDTCGTPDEGSRESELDGWFHITLGTVPIIVRERASMSRPDVRVDSVQYVPADLLPGPNPMLVVWVTNHGERATPIGGEPPQPYPTWIVFQRDTTTVGEVEYNLVIERDQQINVGIELEEEPEGDYLYSARANPTQLYVELYGQDDNAGYVLKEGD